MRHRNHSTFVPVAAPLQLSFFSKQSRFTNAPKFVFPNPSKCATLSMSLRSSAPVKSPTAEKSYALEAWLAENGMYLSPQATWGRPKHPLAIANETTDDGEYSGRGLVATKPIVQGECLFEVPIKVILTKEAALENVPFLDDSVNEYVALAILLILEREKGSKSFWAPYFDVLPTEDELIPIFRWSEEDRLLLEGSPVLVAALSLSTKLEKEFQDAEMRYFTSNRDTFSEDTFTLQSWEWAFAILFSRAISLTSGNIIALVPYADLLNHNPFCSTYIDIHQELLSREKFVRLYTDRSYSLTDQVFVTYGPKPNGDLLLLYGFVSDRNPYDSVELVVSLQSDDPLYKLKKEYLDQSGVQQTSKFPLYRDRYPMELVEFLRFCFANKAEFETADFGDFVTEANETLVAQAIISACESAIEGYPQTREEDDAIMADLGMFQMLTLKQRWAVRQRRSEKRILERTISSIQQEMMDPKFMFTESKENA